jgi:nucleotide-binding universal stress UspA family protein
VFTHILLPVDGSAPSLRGARHGIELARALQARVTILTVTTPWATQFARELAVVVPDVIVPEIEYDHKREAAAAGILQDALADARAAGVPARALHRCHRDPYQAIIDVAARERCDLIVMASHNRQGIFEVLLGSESETLHVMQASTVPLLVYREHARAG